MNPDTYQIINLSSIHFEKSRLIRQLRDLQLDPKQTQTFHMLVTKKLQAKVSPIDRTILVQHV